MITVVMPCYLVNQELLELTQAAIDSLGEVKLIVIDNGSPMGGGYLRDKADLYIRNKENKGYAVAVNQGLKLAGDGLVAIANNDVRVSPNWQIVANEVFDNGNVFSCHFRMTDYVMPFKYGNEIVYQGKERWCTGSFFVIDNSYELLYDEGFFNSYDDWDFFMSARDQGFYTAYTDKACYQHHHSTTQQLIPERVANDTKNREYFKSKWDEYPEDRFARLYPEQMRVYYPDGFKL